MKSEITHETLNSLLEMGKGKIHINLSRTTRIGTHDYTKYRSIICGGLKADVPEHGV
jgi:hypothetical protein